MVLILERVISDDELVRMIQMTVDDLNSMIGLCKTKGIKHVVTTDQTTLDATGMTIHYIKLHLFKVLA